MSRAACLAALAALAAAPAARAHEVLHAVERGRAVALKAYFADGEVLAYAQYEIYAPSDPRIPHQKGRTDRQGWLAFVPDAPGRWRVKVVDGSGHGLEVEVDAAEPAPPAGGATTSAAAFVFRPLVGLAAIGAVFFVLIAVHRRRRTTP
ncbi:MAG TPA: hypothetical protein VH880_07615 [Anaeromyxobacteraceae bacterium]